MQTHILVPLGGVSANSVVFSFMPKMKPKPRNPILSDVAATVRNARKNENFSQRQMREKLEGYTGISMVETGDRLPSDDVAFKIADILSLPPVEFLDLVGNERLVRVELDTELIRRGYSEIGNRVPIIGSVGIEPAKLPLDEFGLEQKLAHELSQSDDSVVVGDDVYEKNVRVSMFAVRVDGDHLRPCARGGDVMVFSIQKTPKPGDIVLLLDTKLDAHMGVLGYQEESITLHSFEATTHKKLFGADQYIWVRKAVVRFIK